MGAGMCGDERSSERNGVFGLIQELLIWVCTIVLLAYTLPACYYDLKYREMPVNFWAPMILICLPVTAYLYWTGTYPWYLGALSLGIILIYFMLERLDLLQGADFMYLMWITLFLVQNPRTGNVLMPVSFNIFLLASIVGIAIVYQAVTRYKWIPEQENFPFMLAISLALWLTVFLT